MCTVPQSGRTCSCRRKFAYPFDAKHSANVARAGGIEWSKLPASTGIQPLFPWTKKAAIAAGPRLERTPICELLISWNLPCTQLLRVPRVPMSGGRSRRDGLWRQEPSEVWRPGGRAQRAPRIGVKIRASTWRNRSSLVATSSPLGILLLVGSFPSSSCSFRVPRQPLRAVGPYPHRRRLVQDSAAEVGPDRPDDVEGTSRELSV